MKRVICFLPAELKKWTCGENYPSWSEIESSLFLLLSSWADKSIHALVTRINEKSNCMKKVLISLSLRKTEFPQLMNLIKKMKSISVI